ncbi:DUF5381 family protein [Paenibacillus polymyxa]|uniref:DUF5381 family protein n=1 Tax=Paenibacillus polymyxa TaxID=1406 RepID=UPI00296E450C|nr:DUF5381 family protein [Paenibacillus polymyxa]WOZ37169.1 DUF5381 family protein [Paenibacillus polymyxa]
MDKIVYRRSLAFWKALGSLMFVLICLFLLLLIFIDEDISALQIFFFITSAMIGIPFFGSYLVVCLNRTLRKDTFLFIFDEHSISDGIRTVPWSAITKVEFEGASIRKWLRPRFPTFIFHLNDRSTWEVSTDYVLNDMELNQAGKQLRTLINQYGKPKKKRF